MDRWSIRSVYFYLVCFATLLMLIFGTVQLVRSAIDLAYPNPPYVDHYRYPVPAEKEPPQLSAEEIERQEAVERERQLEQQRHYAVRQMLEGVAMLIIAGPVYVYHWRRVQAEHRAQR